MSGMRRHDANILPACLQQAGEYDDTRNWDHIREVWLNPENDRALTTKVA